MRLLIALAALAAVYHYAATPGLLLLAAAAVCYLLFRVRPFKTCPSCKGYGSKTRILGGIKPCRHCHGTGLRKRSQRRKARRLLGDQNTGRGRL